MKIMTPHDKFFKETMSKLEVTESFLENYLPEQIKALINFEKLKLEKDTFIDETLKETYADLLFKTDINGREGYIYFLFEHKSYISKTVAFQLLKYMTAIWEAKITEENQGELPIIIPLIFYQGKEKWNIGNSFGEIIKGYGELPPDIKKYIPDFEYLLYDISKYKDEDIKGIAYLQSYITIIRDIFVDGKDFLESLFRAIEYLKELENQEDAIGYLNVMLRYVFSAKKEMSKKDYKEIVKKIETTYSEGSEVVMTLADIFREEGLEKGMEKGIGIGEKRTLLKTNIKLLTKKFGPLTAEVKAKLEKLDKDTLEIITDSILEIESLKDIEKYLN